MVEKRPFLTLIKEVASKLTDGAIEIKNNPRVTLSQDNDTNTVVKSSNDLLSDVNELRSIEEKLIYICKQGDDHSSFDVLVTLIDQWDASNKEDILKKITDKSTNGCSLLHLCAARNKVKCMEYLLLTWNVPVDPVDSLSATPLLYAVASKKEESASFLISNGANVNVKDAYNRFPLMVALKNKSYNIAAVLKSVQNCDVHLRSAKGNTALHLTCEEGDLNGTKFLVETCGASPMRRNYDEQNSLYLGLRSVPVSMYLASQFSGKGLAKLIVNRDSAGRNIFHEACVEGYMPGFLAIMKHLDANEITSSQITELINRPDRTGDTPLIMAVKAGNSDLVAILCSSEELDINSGDRVGNTALYHAISRKDKKSIDYLNLAGGSLKSDTDDEYTEKERNCVGLDWLKSLNSLLIVVISALVVISIAVIAVVCFSFFGTNNKANGDQLRRVQFNQVINFLNGNVQQFTQVAITAASGFEGRYNVSDINDVTEFAWRTLPPNFGKVPLIAAVYCGLDTGENAGLSRSPANRSQLHFLNSYEDRYRIKFVDVTDIPSRSLNDSSAYDIELTSDAEWNGTWVQTARENVGNRWTLSFATDAYPGMLWISFMSSIRDKSNKFIGYCGFDAATEVIRDFIQTSEETKDSTIAIIERQTGYLITTSDTNVQIFSKMPSGEFLRYTGKNCGNKLIEAMTQKNPIVGKDILKFNGSEYRYGKISIDGSRYGLQMANMDDGNGLDWIVLHAVPMSTYYRNIVISFIIMSCCTLVLLVLGVIASVIIARIVMRPIYHIITQAEDIKLLQLEKVEQSLAGNLSFFTEVRNLQQSFKSMTGRIKQFRSFIPDHILSVIEAEVNRGTETKQFEQSKKGTEEASADTGSESRGSSITDGYLHGRGMISNALKTSLTSANITVMVIQFSDLNEILELNSPSDVADTTRELLVALKKAIGKTQGQFVYVTAKQAMIAWNTLLSQHDHASRACKTARLCLEQVATLKSQWKSRDLPLLDIFIGISSGPSYYGNVGGDRNKFFSVIGGPVSSAEKLSSLNHNCHTNVLCSESTYDTVRHDFYFRSVATDDNFKVLELGGLKEDDAWIKEMDGVVDRVEWI